MVLSQGKIPGHSGTEFKDRKAFQNRPFLQSHKLPTPRHSTPISIEQRLKAERSRITKKQIQFLLLVLSTAAVIYYFWETPQVAEQYAQELQQQEQQSANLERIERYQFLVRSGDNYRREGSWDAAQEEYRLALQADPKGEEALKGMTLTLLTKCYLYGIDCKDAEAYLASWPQAVQAYLQKTTVKVELTKVESTRIGPLHWQP